MVIFLPAIIHQIIGNVIEPKIFGDAFGLHPITIILSLIFWGMIWGIIGVLLAAPLTAITSNPVTITTVIALAAAWAAGLCCEG